VRPAAALALLLAASPAAAGPPRGARGEVVLDGERVAVRWSDGDSFRVGGGRWKGRRARLAGVNALETFGPVHRFARAAPEDLLAIARSSAALAASEAWACAATGAADGYGRLLVSCPGAALALVSRGHAMVYAVDGAAAAGLLAAQREAQRRGEGMWRWGVPRSILASVHSADEPRLAAGAYDRVVDMATGEAHLRPHGRRYAACEEVCAGDGGERSCMRYVPFERRYRDRPSCLWEGR
jgi:endonuclease YncB( thermonuclease family)